MKIKSRKICLIGRNVFDGSVRKHLLLVAGNSPKNVDYVHGGKWSCELRQKSMQITVSSRRKPLTWRSRRFAGFWFTFHTTLRELVRESDDSILFRHKFVTLQGGTGWRTFRFFLCIIKQRVVNLFDRFRIHSVTSHQSFDHQRVTLQAEGGGSGAGYCHWFVWRQTIICRKRIIRGRGSAHAEPWTQNKTTTLNNFELLTWQ